MRQKFNESDHHKTRKVVQYQSSKDNRRLFGSEIMEGMEELI
jgi:hypothetical protein